MGKSSLNQELKHLEEIRAKLGAALEKEQQELNKQKSELISERKKMWEEGAHGINDFDDIVNMASHDERVREEFGHYVRKDEIVRQLSYLMKTPYFGRVDFLEDGLDTEEQIYIGRYGFCNKATYEYDIYDWRTPIANMFYECTLGRASYKCPAGEIGGEITCKRQYQIKEGKLEYFYDTNLAVQDELLGKVLSENTDKVLRVIIDTITKEQNYAIRQAGNTDLLVTGPAGSGKTSVGMHRLAYLLYNNRSSLASDKIVVLSRNQIFSSYISGILPELGEESVQDILFDELVNRGISREFKKKNYYEQVEYLLGERKNSIRKRAICLKYSQEFWDFVKASLKAKRPKKSNAETAMEVYLQLLGEFAERKKSNMSDGLLDHLSDSLLDHLSEDLSENLSEGLSEDLPENFDRKTLEDIFAYTKDCLENLELMYEDMLAIGYIRILLGGIRAMEQISHVVLDEAQDYSRLQLMIIKAIYSKSKFTILADPNQAICPEISTIDMETFRQIFGSNLKEIALSKSYRSTAPINAFAFDILGIHNTELYVDRPGKEPECIVADNPMEAIEKIIRQTPEEKSIAILTCDKDSAFYVRRGLGNFLPETGSVAAEMNELQPEAGRTTSESSDLLSKTGRKIEYIFKPERTLEEKIVVMPSMLAKGLEFDVVIVLDDRTEEYWEKNKHLKYLMCTRALHELYFVREEKKAENRML